MGIKNLFDQLKKSDYTEFYNYETDMFSYLYRNQELINLPFVNTFLIVSSWLGTSMRSGAWTFYEATPIEDIMIAVKHLNEIGESELCRILKKGIHDYQNPLYNDEYPEEWMKESDDIDKWIIEHENWLYHWLYDYILTHEDKIIMIGGPIHENY